MVDCFISYRRTPSAPVATALQAKLESKYGLNVYVDTTRTDGSRVSFPERLMQAIADAPVFVCVLGDRDGEHTLQSEWVLKEIQQAYDLRKFCIPVFQESYKPLPDMPPEVDYLLGFDGVHIFDQKNIMVDESVRQLADLIRPHRKKRFISLRLATAFIILLIALAAAIGFIVSNTPDSPALPTTTSIAQNPTAINTVDSIPKTEVFIADSNATIIAAQIAGTATTEYATSIAPTFTPEPPDPDARPTLSAEQVRVPIGGSNADWTPYEQDFDGIPMMLVGAGCFEMGNNDSYSDERPVHEICFDEPFWIDKTEVNQADFARLSGVQAGSFRFYGPNRPVESITWYEARNFCEIRDGRLPTEAEWEYAARGPDNLIYPWGNEFIAENVIYESSPNSQTALVGSRPSGASWVGGLDMSSNVWEWTLSEYRAYPYDAVDGRENISSDSQRVLRGGSLWGDFLIEMRASNRYRSTPSRGRLSSPPGGGLEWIDFFGFRCMRPYSQ